MIKILKSPALAGLFYCIYHLASTADISEIITTLRPP